MRVTLLAPACLALSLVAAAQVQPSTVCASTDVAGQIGIPASGWMKRVECGSAGCLVVTRGSAPAISADGRYVAFASDATHFTSPAPPAGRAQIYRKDLETGEIVLVSATPSGAAGNLDSGFVTIDLVDASGISISGDGRYVAFISFASDLVASSDVNNDDDVFLRDVVAGTTVRVSTNLSGTAPGTYSVAPRITPDGRYVSFASSASDLVPGDTNLRSDVFLYDRTNGSLERVSLGVGGVQANNSCFEGSLSSDARFVAFCSTASNLDGPFPNGWTNVYVRDRQLGTIKRVSLSPTGPAINKSAVWPRITPDGRFVVFQSGATNLVNPVDPTIQSEIWLADRVNGSVARLTSAAAGGAGGAQAWAPSISADARFVAFYSSANVFVPGDTNARPDAFLLDRSGGAFTRVSVDELGAQATEGGSYPVMSVDARVVAFTSQSALTFGDLNTEFDVFAYDRGSTGAVESFCVAAANSLACMPSVSSTGTPSASAGSGFTLQAANLRNQRSGLFFYSTVGPMLSPFGAGWMCVRAPRIRTGVLSTGGSPPPADDCSGMLARDFNTIAAAGSDPALVAGAEVWAQAWTRDPGAPSNTHMTQGLHFQLGP